MPPWSPMSATYSTGSVSEAREQSALPACTHRTVARSRQRGQRHPRSLSVSRKSRPEGSTRTRISVPAHPAHGQCSSISSTLAESAGSLGCLSMSFCLRRPLQEHHHLNAHAGISAADVRLRAECSDVPIRAPSGPLGDISLGAGRIATTSQSSVFVRESSDAWLLTSRPRCSTCRTVRVAVTGNHGMHREKMPNKCPYSRYIWRRGHTGVTREPVRGNVRRMVRATDRRGLGSCAGFCRPAR